MSDSAEVAGLLWDRWLPGSVRRIISGGLTDADARALAMWMACVHDLGKATPAFAVQVPQLADDMYHRGLTMQRSMPAAERRRAPHSIGSHVLLRRWLAESLDFDPRVAETYAIVPGGHHGVAPSVVALTDADRPHLLGAGVWEMVQAEFAVYAAGVARVTDLLPGWRSRSLSSLAQVLLTGVVIVADWIASDPARFPYRDRRSSTERASAAWVDVGLTPPWRPASPPSAVEDFFAARFDLPADATVRPIQRAVVEMAGQVAEPGLMIIEAPMGEGKTEAALAAAEVFAGRTGAGGCFVALPTMATSNAMFGRVLDWMERLPGDGAASMFLAHGKAALNEEYRELTYRGRPSNIEQDDPDVRAGSGHSETVAVALQWLSGRKKGVLSNFVVGTIDQVLVGALKSRHLVLRHLALAGKVVVIDEAHAADEYMSVYLDRILLWLGAYRVPTIVLSATLPGSRRRAMLAAYEQGRRPESVPERVGPPVLRARRKASTDQVQVPDPMAVLDGDIGYPVIIATGAGGGGPLVAVAEPSGRRLRVRLDRADDDDETLLAVLADALADGGCVGVVRNTVARAQATARLLRERYGSEVILLHSRFLAVDRMSRETQLRGWLGPPGGKVARPARRIVVGTQVLEQSLDIDFDLLITDLAPMDLLLQRIGRLHRHVRPDRNRPAALREPRCVIVGVQDWSAVPPEVVEASEHVYPKASLLRALAVLDEHRTQGDGGSLHLPEDIAPLVQRAYEHGFLTPPTWGDALARAEADHAAATADRQRAAEAFLLAPVPSRGYPIYGWNGRGVGDAEDSVTGQAQVRDGDETIEVIVVVKKSDDYFVPEWVEKKGGRRLTTLGVPDPGVARSAATCTVRLPAWMSSPWNIENLITALEAHGVATWQQSPWLKGQLVLVLDETLHAELPGARVDYDRDDGLVVTQIRKESP